MGLTFAQLGYGMFEYYSTGLGLLELLAALASLICVGLIVIQSRWNFFWGGLGVILFGYVFWEVKLYSDMLLQFLFFLPIQFVGWYQWTYGGTQRDTLDVSSSPRVLGLSVVGIALFVALWGTLMSSMTDAASPYLDSIIVGCSIAAQLMLNRKIVESWLIWIAMDVFAIWFFWYKGLYVTSALYCVFLIMATVGYFTWRFEHDALKAKA